MRNAWHFGGQIRHSEHGSKEMLSHHSRFLVVALVALLIPSGHTRGENEEPGDSAGELAQIRDAF